MAKLSISLPDELADDVHALAPQNVSAFVSTAIRHEIDRRALFSFLDELADELGPVDEDEVAVFTAAWSNIASTKASAPRRGRSSTTGKARSRPVS